MSTYIYIISMIEKPVFIGFVLFAIIVFIFLFFKQEMRARKFLIKLERRKTALNSYNLEQEYKTTSQIMLMDTELELMSNSFSNFMEHNESELKKLHLMTNSRNCSTALSVYQRIWKKL